MWSSPFLKVTSASFFFLFLPFCFNDFWSTAVFTKGKFRWFLIHKISENFQSELISKFIISILKAIQMIIFKSGYLITIDYLLLSCHIHVLEWIYTLKRVWLFGQFVVWLLRCLACCLASLVSLAEWLSVRLRTKWSWVRIPLQSLDIYLSYFSQLESVTFIKVQ